MLIKVLLALVALATLAMLFQRVPPRGDTTVLQQDLVLAGLCVASVGMLVPWGRRLAPDSPGRSLGVVCKALGWGCACELPAAIAFGNAPAVLACVVVCAAWFGVWKEQPWAPWAWYAVSLMCLAASVALLAWILSSADPVVLAFEAWGIFPVVLGVGVGVAVWREIRGSRRKRSQAAIQDSLEA